MNKKLIEAVMDQLGGTEEEKLGTLCDVAEYGADAGFPGFTYYSDTVEFWRKNKVNITNTLSELVNDLGGSCASLVQGFICLDNQFSEFECEQAIFGRYNEKYDLIYNALAWFALEEVARFETDK